MKISIRIQVMMAFASFLVSSSIIEPHAIVFIHIGDRLPSHMYDALMQARMFNKSCPIYLLASREALKSHPQIIEQARILPIELESLARSNEHVAFLQHTSLSNGFWLYTSERFLYLHEFAELYKMQDIIHLETDMMVYIDFETIMPTLRSHYTSIGATLDADDRCIPGLIFFRTASDTQKLAQYFADKAYLGKNDMEIIAQYYCEKASSKQIDALPIIMPDYHALVGLASTKGGRTCHQATYSQYSDELGGIFDGAAIGQYLGGIDPRNGHSAPGFINETCLFDPSKLAFSWEFDNQQRKIPCTTFNGKKYRVYNLHIHSKNLAAFSSAIAGGHS